MRCKSVGVAAAALLALGACDMAGGKGQVVRKDLDTTAQAFRAAFAQGSYNGASQFSDQWHGGMQTFVEQPDKEHLDVVTKVDGATATEAHFEFAPQDEGRATLVTVAVKVDQKVMHKAFEGTAHESIGKLPQAAFAIGMRRMVAKYAERIEQGTALNLPSEGWMTGSGDPPPEFYEGMPADVRDSIRQHEQEEKQDAAAAPTVDPNAAAQAYLHPSR